jgi:hypothetical protein
VQFGAAAAWGLFIVTSLLFAPVWLVRRLKRRIRPGAAIRVRLWPLLAGLSVVAFLLLFAFGMDDPFTLLGAPTTVSMGIMAATYSFALFTLLGASCAWNARRLPINRVAYWHSAAASVLNLVAGLYLLAHGVIGLMTWA